MRKTAIDLSWDSPSVFRFDRDPNRPPATRPSFLPLSSPTKAPQPSSSSVETAATVIPPQIEGGAGVDISASPAMLRVGGNDVEDRGWEGVEDVTETQWAAEVEEICRSNSSSSRAQISDEHTRARSSASSSPHPRSPKQIVDLSDSPLQPMTPATSRRSHSPRSSPPVDWSPSPSGISKPTATKKGVREDATSLIISPSIDITDLEEAYEPEDGRYRLSSAQKGKSKVPAGPTLNDLFADDELPPLPPLDEGDDYDQFDEAFGDDMYFAALDDGVEAEYRQSASTSNTPNRPAALAPLSTHKPHFMSDPLPSIRSPPKVIHPITLIQDLPPDIQEFYLNHWRRGADKASTGREKRVLEIHSDDEDEDAMPTAMSKRRTPVVKRGRGRGGFRGSWGRGRGVRGRGAARGRKR